MVKDVSQHLSLNNVSQSDNPSKPKTQINKEILSKFAQNAEIPDNIKPVFPNFYNTQSSNRIVNINQKTDIHVSGISDPMFATRNVRNEQDAINLQITRNSKGVKV